MRALSTIDPMTDKRTDRVRLPGLHLAAVRCCGSFRRRGWLSWVCAANPYMRLLARRPCALYRLVPFGGCNGGLAPLPRQRRGPARVVAGQRQLYGHHMPCVSPQPASSPSSASLSTIVRPRPEAVAPSLALRLSPSRGGGSLPPPHPARIFTENDVRGEPCLGWSQKAQGGRRRGQFRGLLRRGTKAGRTLSGAPERLGGIRRWVAQSRGNAPAGGHGGSGRSAVRRRKGMIRPWCRSRQLADRKGRERPCPNLRSGRKPMP
jgi:hypothetical protein